MSSDPPARSKRRSVRLGKYEVVAHIATGGMGAVYKAIDSVLKREVALKVLPPDMASQPNALERFRREACNAAKLRHENIVTIYEFSQSGTTFYLAMEFIEGIDLHEYIERKGRLDPEEARIVTIQAAHALEHAYTQGIVHRDIKPSNFLVTRKGDKLVVKLSDFGLARETADVEARVTKDGMTVGTVDYMAPEQARDSGLADCRSDIYSLGCTLFHMLAGRALFPEGSIPERLYKHAHEEPADLRQQNPRVSEGLCAIVRRMLAKEPAERYQTPSALVKDLVHLDSATARITAPDTLAGLALAAGEQPKEKLKRRPSAEAPEWLKPPPAPTSPRKGRRDNLGPDETPGNGDDRSGGGGSVQWIWAAGAGAVAVGIAIAGMVLAFRRPAASPDPVHTVELAPSTTEKAGMAPVPESVAHQNAAPPPGPPPQPLTVSWPALYEPSVPLVKEALAKDFLGPWEGLSDPGPDVPVLRVSRQPADGGFVSLEAACAAAPKSLTVIEINDNGPLFVAPIRVAERNLVIRSGPGYRPLLVWDVERGREATDRSASWLTVAGGSLTLDRVDVVGKWPESPASGRPFLLRVTDGDLLARDCTFSFDGRPPAGLGVVRFERSNGGDGPRAGGRRCRLSRCVGRGPGLVALDLDSPGADVLLDGSLFLGTNQALLQVTARTVTPTVLRLLRSTLVVGQVLLHIDAAVGAAQPELEVRAWDALLARGGNEASGQMVVLAEPAGSARMKWQATNCLYTGWGKLLKATSAAAEDLRAWQSLWQRTEGDLAIPPPWPAVLAHDPCEVSLEALKVDPAPASPVGYAATSGQGPLGCDAAALPLVRTNWLGLCDDYPPPDVDTISDDRPPPIPAGNDGRYHGGRVDLNSTPDLGVFLDDMARGKGLGPRVVLHLTGSGSHKTTALRVKGSSLVLYFRPAAAGAEPPTLMPQDRVSPEDGALIDVTGGSLDVIGGTVSLPDFRLAPMPPYGLKVRGGDMRLFRCRLFGPVQHGPDAYRGLIYFEGSSGIGRPAGCSLNECVLISGKSDLHLVGTGARLRLRHCVVVAADDGIHLDPSTAARARLDVHCLLEHSTVAARHGAVRLSDAPQIQGSVEPIVLTARFSAFLNPFTGSPAAGTPLAAANGALARGLLLWQGVGNAFDKRLGRGDGGAAWSKLWGRAWELRQALDVPLQETVDLDKPALERLALPQGAVKPPPGEANRPQPGADFQLLGLVKGSAKPSP
jgi:serine/threonine-protein kinase